MDKYIKAQDVREAFANYIWSPLPSAISYANLIVEKIPAADVALVRHGHWIELENGDYKCSLCGCYHHTWEAHGYYCQHCGARMDGDI